MKVDNVTWIRELQVVRTLAPDDPMRRSDEGYFNVGRAALMAIAAAMTARSAYVGGTAEPRRILDFGCGFGRVARFLKAAYASARVDVTDLKPEAVAFCVGSLGCKALVGKPGDNIYDLIWLGSVFTHLSPDDATSLLATLKAALRPRGVLIFTSRGRYSVDSADTGVGRLTPERTAAMLRDYHETGYGFVDHKQTPGYGVSTVKPSWYTQAVVDRNFIQIASMEKGWNGNQDVNAFMRHPIDERGKTPVQI